MSGLVIDGADPGKAADVFLSGTLQDPDPSISFSVFANAILNACSDGSCKTGAARTFFKRIVERLACSDTAGDHPKDIQLISAQALTIISWIERQVPDAERIRITYDIDRMVSTEGRGKSFLDRTTLPVEMKRSGGNGPCGPLLSSYGFMPRKSAGASEKLVFDPEMFSNGKDKALVYLKNKGFCRLTPETRELTEEGAVSAIGETFFVNDLLPGSFQTTSTEPGRFQGNRLTIKRVSEGRGIQLNVIYSPGGKIASVMAQEIREGDWTLALPGCVEYVINLGGLRYNDISLKLSAEEAAKFSPDLDLSEEALEKTKKAVSGKNMKAPYLAVKIRGEAYLVKNLPDAPAIKWFPSPEGIIRGMEMTSLYGALTKDTLEMLVEMTHHYHSWSVTRKLDGYTIKLLDDDILKRGCAAPRPVMGKRPE
ncbi:MAG: hypothetical protein GF408_07500 [Candidatus Omnitrophica bacterium]|nr:hypothetical protein [Candidatus Omnitrophota bacterium]